MPEVCRRGISLSYGLLAYVVRLLPTGTQESVTADLVEQLLQQVALLIDRILLRHTALSGESPIFINWGGIEPRSAPSLMFQP